MTIESTPAGPGGNGHNSGSALSATAPADQELSGASLEFHHFLADIEDLIKATTSLTGEDLAKARAKLNERIAAAKRSAQAAGGAIVHRARHSAAVTDAYVHERPWTAVGIGAVLGVLLGFALARRA